MRLAGQTTLVTGASRNTGRAIALRFAAEGANVILGAQTSRDALESVAAECQEFGVQALPMLGDVANPDDVQALVDAGMEKFGRIDSVVSTVAIRPHTSIVELSLGELHRVIEVNLYGSFHLAQSVTPHMINQKGGSIIAIGGLTAISGTKNSSASGASKAGLLGLIRALAVELGPYGIRANMVVPGNIATETEDPASHSSADRNIQESNDRSPLRRAGSPSEIAAACLFLASEDGSYVTGEHLMCNGGRFID
jgi:3-oxoacyl-[acyl-carrier protein] reductase